MVTVANIVEMERSAQTQDARSFLKVIRTLMSMEIPYRVAYMVTVRGMAVARVRGKRADWK